MGTSGADNGLHAGAAGILSDPRQAAGGGVLPGGVDGDKQDAPDPKEEALVKKFWHNYERARKFDENFRKQVAIDRRYAAGTSDLSWAVSTNIIGAFIDILVALLYARDPDVSCKKAEQIDASNTQQMDVFAQTLEIVISNLWRKGKLKKQARKAVRSVLSCGEGWIKCNLISEKVPQPQTEAALNDVQETLGHLRAQSKLLEDPQGMSQDEVDAAVAENEALKVSLTEKLELSINKLFCIDFVPCERMQIATNVTAIEDYLEADWISNEEYLSVDEALARFDRLSPEVLKSAKIFYQQAPKELTTRDIDNVLPQGMLTAESAQAFVQSQSSPDEPCFVRVLEQWNRKDKLIRTTIEGVKQWAALPYPPPTPSLRFFPYFYLGFFEVDGNRHAQSLSWRLYKLQDEYSTARSNFRLTRERSIPGVLFNATMLDESEARKLEKSKHQEYTALRPADPTIPLANIFAPKPVQSVDMRVFDPTLILNDMERVSGVQEALSGAMSAPGNPETATAVNVQQAGTQARTSCNRDFLEDLLTDLAQYTAQQALQCLTIPEAQRMAGPKAFWPEGMSIEDLFTLVEIKIEAGTTGKPMHQSDQQAWATILPLIEKMIVQIRQALAVGDKAMATSLTELVKETMKRMGDETDPDRFIPNVPPPGSPGAGAPPPAIMPKLTIQLKGEVDPATAAALAAPAVNEDQVHAAALAALQRPPVPPPGETPPPTSAIAPTAGAPAMAPPTAGPIAGAPPGLPPR
jgi:hypothetical protein